METDAADPITISLPGRGPSSNLKIMALGPLKGACHTEELKMGYHGFRSRVMESLLRCIWDNGL